MTSKSEIKNQPCRNTRCDEATRARAASKARIAYSVKCAALRTRKCTRAIAAGLMFGKSQSSKGRKIREVLAAENSPLEANQMKAIQSSNGP